MSDIRSLKLGAGELLVPVNDQPFSWLGAMFDDHLEYCGIAFSHGRRLGDLELVEAPVNAL